MEKALTEGRLQSRICTAIFTVNTKYIYLYVRITLAKIMELARFIKPIGR